MIELKKKLLLHVYLTFCISGQGNCIFYQKSQGILKRDDCCNQVEKSPHLGGGVDISWKVLNNLFEAFLILLCFFFICVQGF